MTREKKFALVIPGYPEAPILEALGYVAIEHAWFDHMIKLVIKRVMDLKQEDIAHSFDRVGSKELRETLEKAAKRRLGLSPAFIKLKNLLGKARKLSDARNGLLHALWGHLADEHAGDISKYDKIPTREEILAIARDLRELQHQLDIARKSGGWLDIELQKKPAIKVEW